MSVSDRVCRGTYSALHLQCTTFTVHIIYSALHLQWTRSQWCVCALGSLQLIVSICRLI